MSLNIPEAREAYQQGDAFKLLVDKLHWLTDYDLPALHTEVANAQNRLNLASDSVSRAMALKAELERGIAALDGIAV